jgi:malonate decarboxylase epsilon subunit
MLHVLPDHPEVAATLREACDVLQRDVLLLDEERTLESTIATQIALYIAGVAVARSLIAEGAPPDAVAGLSVGAYAAAAVSGAIGFQDGLLLVQKRAEMTAECFPSGYGLAAIVGLDEQKVSKLVAECTTPEHPVFVGNLNAPRQIVIAGSIEGMEKVLALARRSGSRKAERLAVRIPSHCALFEGVANKLVQAMANLEPHTPSAVYITNRGGRPTRSFDRIREDLATNIAHPVRWHDSTQVLVESGVSLFVEMNPGHVLTSLASEAFPEVRAIAAENTPAKYLLKLIGESQERS